MRSPRRPLRHLSRPTRTNPARLKTWQISSPARDVGALAAATRARGNMHPSGPSRRDRRRKRTRRKSGSRCSKRTRSRGHPRDRLRQGYPCPRPPCERRRRLQPWRLRSHAKKRQPWQRRGKRPSKPKQQQRPPPLLTRQRGRLLHRHRWGRPRTSITSRNVFLLSLPREPMPVFARTIWESQRCPAAQDLAGPAYRTPSATGGRSTGTSWPGVGSMRVLAAAREEKGA